MLARSGVYLGFRTADWHSPKALLLCRLRKKWVQARATKSISTYSILGDQRAREPMPALRSKIASGVVWSFFQIAAERLIQAAAFLTTARLLGPAEFGLAALAVAPTA